MKKVAWPNFTEQEHSVWRELFKRQSPLRSEQMVGDFELGLNRLGITGERIPDLDKVNSKLKALTGFEGVPVVGLEEGPDFFEMISQRQFPIGSFIRDAKDLNYTPAPDVFHDLYGHIPFFVKPDYAKFCEDFGVLALKYSKDPVQLRRFERLFWFTIEFALMDTPKGKRIFGAGIASSFGECAYSLSDKPEVLAFDLKMIRDQEFRIDQIQPKLFKLKSEAQLYSCLLEFEKLIA